MPDMPQPPGIFTGRRINVETHDAAFGDVVWLIADVSKLNVVVREPDRLRFSDTCVNVPWDLFLTKVLQRASANWVRAGNVSCVGCSSGPATPIPITWMGDPIDLEVRRESPEELLRRAAAFTHRRVLVGTDCAGKASVRFHGVPSDLAVESIVQAFGLALLKAPDGIRVDSPGRTLTGEFHKRSEFDPASGAPNPEPAPRMPLRVAAVVWGISSPRALLVDSAGLAVVVRSGDVIGDVTVDGIEPGGVAIRGAVTHHLPFPEPALTHLDE